MGKAQARRVVAFKPDPARMIQTIRMIATEDQKVFFGPHANERMVERDITRLDAMRVLKTGQIDGDITPGRNRGEWKCKVTGKVKGSREIGVVSIVARGCKIFVKTVEWEDL